MLQIVSIEAQMDLLDVWSKSLTAEQKDQLLKDNFQKLDVATQFSGFSVVSSIVTTSTKTLTTSFSDFRPFTTSFDASGGLYIFVVKCNVHAVHTASIDVTSSFVVDNTERDKSVWHGYNQDDTAQFFILFPLTLSAGKHNVKLNLKSSAGTATVNDNSNSSALYIIELRKG
jgi:hypothetical protein